MIILGISENSCHIIQSHSLIERLFVILPPPSTLEIDTDANVVSFLPRSLSFCRKASELTAKRKQYVPTPLPVVGADFVQDQQFVTHPFGGISEAACRVRL